MTESVVAVVGGDSLLAKEIRELLKESKPAPEVRLISAAAEGASVFDVADDEATVLPPLTSNSLQGAQITLLAGTAASSRRTMKLDPEAPVIDLTGALEDRPEARLRAPSAEAPGSANNAKSVQVIAHPAAIALATFLAAVARVSGIRRSIIHVFEPASERGQAGLNELQQQTVAVLSFKKLKTDVFDAQLGFNLLARYGEEATEPLELIEQRVERHLASLLAAWPAIPMPSLKVIQAPVFHGHSFSIWAEFEESVSPEEWAKALSDAGIDVRQDEPPSNAGIAGVSGLAVGGISTDPNHPRAAWFWMVADNLRLAAENAVAVAREML